MADNNRNEPEIDLVIEQRYDTSTNKNKYDHELIDTNNSQGENNAANIHLITDLNSINNTRTNLQSIPNPINTAAGIVNKVIDLGEDAVKNSTEFISNTVSSVVDTRERIVDKTVDIVQDAADIITTPMKKIVDTVTETVKEIEDNVVTSIKTGAAVGKIMIETGNNIRERSKENNGNTDNGSQSRKKTSQKTITPADHSIIGDSSVARERTQVNDYFATPLDHVVYDPERVNFGTGNTLTDAEELQYKKTVGLYADGSKKFTGSATIMDPDLETDPEKIDIMENGLDDYDEKRNGNKNIKERTTPLSSIRSFVSADPTYAHESIFASYNRTLLPVADVEFRKGFKHIMISRPECYIMWNGTGLSQQAEYDIDFNSAYTRMPHICELLSPSYIAGGRLAGTTNGGVLCNWNFLLSNMISSFSGDYKTSISTKEGMTKSIEGHTILPGGTLQSTMGGTLNITFRETKHLEVYECLKLWMLYIHKIRKGIFAPSYNGYMYENGYLDKGTTTVSTGYPMYHPYDRALDYTCSIFQNITNESMTQILYWDKYYGCYPVEATLNGIDSSTNAITGPLTVTASFRYQYKAPACRNINLIEFNYNSGLVDHVGHTKHANPYTVANSIVSDDINGVKNYIGPLDLFTGTPYIVMGRGSENRVTKGFDTNNVWVPYLRFVHNGNDSINGYMNLSLTKSVNDNDILVTSS